MSRKLHRARVHPEGSYGGEGQWLSIGLVPNLGSAVGELNLDDFAIRKIQHDELVRYFPDTKLPTFFDFRSVRSPHFIVFGELTPAPPHKLKEEKVTRSDGRIRISLAPLRFYGLGLAQFRKPLLLLNLFKNASTPAFVSVGLFRYTSECGQYAMRERSTPIDWMENLLCTDEDGELYTPTDYYLDRDDIQPFRVFKDKVYQELMKEDYGSKEKFFHVASDFFLEGCLKELENEKEGMAALDYIIGLEALLMENEAELKYRFANRLAILLGNSDQDRSEFQEYADDIYGLRNKIVHGKHTRDEVCRRLWDTKGKGLNHRKIGDGVFSIREVVRRSIVYVLSLYLNGFRDQKSMIRMLDAALFGGHERERLVMMRTRLSARKVG